MLTISRAIGQCLFVWFVCINSCLIFDAIWCADFGRAAFHNCKIEENKLQINTSTFNSNAIFDISFSWCMCIVHHLIPFMSICKQLNNHLDDRMAICAWAPLTAYGHKNQHLPYRLIFNANTVFVLFYFISLIAKCAFTARNPEHDYDWRTKWIFE